MPTKKSTTRSKKTTAKKKNVKATWYSKLFMGKSGKPNPLIALLIVVAVCAMGYYGYVKSNADTFNGAYSVGVQSALGCKLSGRVYENNDCKDKCKYPGGSEFKKTDGKPARGYCTKYVNTEMTAQRCIVELHRYYISDVGCSRRGNQENTNESPQCIPGYPNYVADATTDRCIPQTIVGANTGSGAGSVGTGTPTGTPATPTAPTTPTTPTPTTPTTPTNPTPTPTPLPTPPPTNTPEACELLGRKWDAKKKSCTTTCLKNAGTLVIGLKSGVKYCTRAISVTANGNEAACSNKLHRVWLVEGCARRPDQKDAARSDKETLLQCLPTFNYYNADFNNKAETKETLTDVCELSKAVAKVNETNGTAGMVAQVSTDTPTTPGTNTGTDTGSTDGSTNPTGTTDETVGDFRITVFKKKNFEGDSKVFTSAQAELPKGWNDNISSFKIQKGRWQICEDANFTTDCTKRWASDADLSSGEKNAKLQNDKISSLRPVTVTTFEDAAEDVIAACANSAGQVVAPNADNTCPADATLACPATYVLQAGECKEQTISPAESAPVDSSFKGKEGEANCLLLGREWIQKQKGKDVNGGNYGCSQVTCNLAADGAPRKNEGKPYCVNSKFDAPYAVKTSQKECTDLHRVWIDQVGRCAQVPNRKDKDQTVLKAKQCTGEFTTYYIYSAKKGKTDECFKPDFFKKAQGVVKSTGGVLGAALQQGPKAYCNSVRGGGYHWNAHAKRCDKDRPPTPPAPTQPITSNPDGTTTTAPLSSITESYCEGTLRRNYSNGVCERSCKYSGEKLYDIGTAWDVCRNKKPASTENVPSPPMTCPAGMVLHNNECFGHGAGSGTPDPISYDIFVRFSDGGSVTSSDGRQVAAPHASAVVVHSGSWKMCKSSYSPDRCVTLPIGSYSLSDIRFTFEGDGMEHTYAANYSDIYVKGR
ncbi:hypothetical protein BH09PAT3_BH09PAT3_1530 [soil metagenome]